MEPAVNDASSDGPSGGRRRRTGTPEPTPRQALGLALIDRADEVVDLVMARTFPGMVIERETFASTVLATRLVGHWLATGEVANATDHEKIAKGGEGPLIGRLGLAYLTKAYLGWRDALCDVIREESGRLQVGTEVTIEALTAVRRSCDSSLVRMGRQFDSTHRHLESQVHDERARLTHAALHDRLTGLPNRVQFLDTLEATVADATARDRSCVLFVDLDHFKSVNDHFGHRVGDELVVAVGRRLARIARRSDVVARFAGDEFVILARDLHCPDDDGVRLAERVRSALMQPFRVAGRLVKITASVGVTPVDGQPPEDLLTRADQAMYEAKRLGRNRVSTYTPDLGAEVDHHSRLAHELNFALQRGQFHVVFQPICSIEGEIQEAEALLRWNHPELGAVSPAEFIPIAEKSGLIRAIGAWVLERATEQCASWRADGVPDAVVSVNVSTCQLEAGFPTTVRAALQASRLPADALRLEITESALLGDASESADVLNALGAMGVGLEIDDFGTGYSSLAYLRKLPVQTLKIDRSFVSGLGQAGGDAPIVRAMIELAHNLGLIVVAEGVEETTELEALREMGCDRVQGYLLGRPSPADTVGWPHADHDWSNRPVASALHTN